MKIKVSEEKENVFLKRKELLVSIEHEKAATPNKAALQQLIAKQFSFRTESIEIKSIFSETGLSSSRAKIFVWSEKTVPDLSVSKEKESKTEQESKEEAKENKEKEQAQ